MTAPALYQDTNGEVVVAAQFTLDVEDAADVWDWLIGLIGPANPYRTADYGMSIDPMGGALTISTDQGRVTITPGEWVIRDTSEAFTLIKPEDFANWFTPMEDQE